MVRHVLQVEDNTWCGEDMNEVDIVPQQQDKFLKTLNCITELKYD